MFETELSVCIHAAPDDVWRRLADLPSIVDWAPGIKSASCEPGEEAGVGAVRHCVLTGGVLVAERWTDWHEGRSFTYEGSGLPGVDLAQNTWTVHPDPQGTLVTSRATVAFGGGRLAIPLEFIARRQARRMGRITLGRLKHLVERGYVPASANRLPAPANC